jgi:hypothetical protein
LTTFCPASSYRLAAPQVYDAGESALGIVAADFNGDGWPDLAITDGVQDSVGILLNQGNGMFGSPAWIPVGSYPVTVAAGDLGSGGTDLVVLNANDHSVSILTNQGGGQFGAAPAIQFPSVGNVNGPGIALVDWNHDGRTDIVVPDNWIVVLLNPPEGFAAAAEVDGGVSTITSSQGFVTSTVAPMLPPGNWPSVVSAGLVDTGPYPPGLGVIADPDGGGPVLVSSVALSAQSANVVYAASADLNGDGFPDVVAADEGDGVLLVCLSSPDGGLSFADAGSYPTPGVDYLILADVNGDGFIDVVAGCTPPTSPTSNVTVWLNNGDGTFGPMVTQQINSALGLAQVAVADFNGDGIADVAVTSNYSASTVSILSGQCQ